MYSAGRLLDSRNSRNPFQHAHLWALNPSRSPEVASISSCSLNIRAYTSCLFGHLDSWALHTPHYEIASNGGMKRTTGAINKGRSQPLNYHTLL